MKGWDFLLEWISIKVSKRHKTNNVGQSVKHVDNERKSDDSGFNSNNYKENEMLSRYSGAMELDVKKLRK